MMINRIINNDSAEYMIFSMLTMFFSIPRNLSKVEALAVFPGQGEIWRIKGVLEYWEQGFGNYLFVAGDWLKYQTQNSLEGLKNLGLRRTENVFLDEYAQITPDQVNQLLSRCRELGVSSVALFSSPYHIFRAYCTVIGLMMKSGEKWLSLIPMAVNVSPDKSVPETNATAWDMAPGELERVIKYQKKGEKKGDVCSFDELRQYISWLWQNFLKKEEV